MSIYSNILETALRIIPPETISYRKYLSNTINDIGLRERTYGEPVSIRASVQPGIISSFGGKNISEKDYAEMGLDWSKSYITVWVMVDIGNIYSGESPDQIEVHGKKYNIIQCADWIVYNGWKRLYCVEVQNESRV